MRAPLTVAGVALAVLLLASCAAGGGSPESPVADPAPTGADSGDTSSGEADIPDTFPRDEVPLLDAEVVFAIDLGTGWTVVVATDDVAEGYEDAVALLEGAGFTAASETSSAEGSVGQFTTDDYTVNLTATDSPDFGNSVSYTVVIRG